MPIGVFTGIFGLLAVTTLVSGLYLLLNARAVAQEASRLDNDVVVGPRNGGRRHPARARVRAVGAVFLLALLGLGAFILLYVTSVIGPDTVASDPASVQRP